MRYYLPAKLPELMQLAGKRVLLIGLGTFGGGVGAAKFLAGKGAKVTVTDLRSKAELQESIDAINNENVEYIFGNHDWVDIPAYDLICVNPAVSQFNPLVLEAIEKGIPVTSEINLFFAHCNAKIIGVTGSNGKSTTAALTAHLLSGSGRRVWFGGNIGYSLLPEVANIGENDLVVLELSSFLLDQLHMLPKSPTATILTNLSNNHLDRHKSYDAYFAAKMAAFCYQKSSNISIINYDDPASHQMLSYVSGRIVTYSTMKRVTPGGFIQDGAFWVDLGKKAKNIANINSLKLVGKFNQSNALAAITAAMVFKTPVEEIARLLPQFKGLPHRLEFVGEKSGIRFYNDSISTTPESTIAGISAFSRPVWLIVGGSNKGMNYGKMAMRILNSSVIGVLGIGEIGKSILNQIYQINQKNNIRKNINLNYLETLEDAFDSLMTNAQKGQVVLLSPGTASYDQFKNFQARGELFSRLVNVFDVGRYGDDKVKIGRKSSDSRIIRASAGEKTTEENESEELSKALEKLSDDSKKYGKEHFKERIDSIYQSVSTEDANFEDSAQDDMIKVSDDSQFSYAPEGSSATPDDFFMDNNFEQMLEQSIDAAFDNENALNGADDGFGDEYLPTDKQVQLMDFGDENFESFDNAFDDSQNSDPFSELREQKLPEISDSKPLFPDEPNMLDPIDTQHLNREYLDKAREDLRVEQQEADYEDEFGEDDFSDF